MTAFNRFFGTHPAAIAFLLGGGGFVLGYFAYAHFYVGHPQDSAQGNIELLAAGQWVLLIIGGIAWLLGGVAFGRRLGLHWFVALMLHLIPVLGLLIMRIIGRALTPHELWARENPGLDGKTAKRTYRPMKPLY